MGSRFVNPDPQFLDAKGNPLNGGSVAFFLSGTSTPAITYADQALTTPNTNPVVLGSDGRLGNCFLDPSVTYRAILSDSLGNVLFTMDPINNIGSALIASFQVYPGNPNSHVAGNAGTQGVRGADAVWDTVDQLLFICKTTGSASGAVWTPLVSGITGNEDVITATTYVVVAGDAGRIKSSNNSSPITFTLSTAASLGGGTLFGLKNIGTGRLTINTSGADTIEGASSFSLGTNQGILVYCTGSTFRVLCQYDSQGNFDAEVTVASAATCDVLGAASEQVAISGTTTVTSFGTAANRRRKCRAIGAFTITQNATSLILPTAANITTAAGDTWELVSDVSGNVRVIWYQRASGATLSTSTPAANSGLTGALFGLTLSNDSGGTTAIAIAAGTARDSTDVDFLTLAAALTGKVLANAWSVGNAGGFLDTGAVGNNTYHVYLIKRLDTGVVDAIASLSASAPTLPTNYTEFRRIGSIVRVGGAIKLFQQDGDRFRWKSASVQDVAATNPGTSAVTRTLTVPTGIVVWADIVAAVNPTFTVGNFALLTSLDETDRAASSTDFNLSTGASAGNPAYSSALLIKTNTLAQIRSRLASSGGSDVLTINTFGWVDQRGRQY